MTKEEIKEIIKNLRVSKNLKKEKTTDSMATYTYADKNHTFYTYDDPTKSVERLTKNKNNQILFTRYNTNTTYYI